MKKYIKLLLIICLLVCTYACNNKTIISEYEIMLEKEDHCTDKVDLYYESSDTKIYLVCLNEINLKKDKVITLKYYLSNTWQTLKDGVKHFTDDMILSNEIIYTKGNLTIIECNNNIYFMSSNINYDNKFCEISKMSYTNSGRII